MEQVALTSMEVMADVNDSDSFAEFKYKFKNCLKAIEELSSFCSKKGWDMRSEEKVEAMYMIQSGPTWSRDSFIREIVGPCIVNDVGNAMKAWRSSIKEGSNGTPLTYKRRYEGYTTEDAFDLKRKKMMTPRFTTEQYKTRGEVLDALEITSHECGWPSAQEHKERGYSFTYDFMKVACSELFVGDKENNNQELALQQFNGLVASALDVVKEGDMVTHMLTMIYAEFVRRYRSFDKTIEAARAIVNSLTSPFKTPKDVIYVTDSEDEEEDGQVFKGLRF